MEGVGARLGRSSNRYGPTTVFTGPVRKWKKKWVNVAPHSSSTTTTTSNNTSHHHNHVQSVVNGSVQLLLFKWSPISNGGGGEESNGRNEEEESDGVREGKRRRRKYKYIPVAALDEHKRQTEEVTDDDDDDTTHGPYSKKGSLGEKPDINDVPMEESQKSRRNGKASARQDLNVSTLDLSLGLSSHEDEHESDSRTN
ncbi:hypothetical protein Droror1_Dr00005480 [Drosera rotundifolia]